MTTDDERSTPNDPTAHQEAAPGTVAPGVATPGSAAPNDAPQGAAAPGSTPAGQQAPYTGWPTPAAPVPRARRKTLVITGIAVGALILLGGAFGGGVAVGTTIDRQGPGSFSEQVMPGGPDGPGDRGGDGEMPQPPTRDGDTDTDTDQG